MEPLSYVMVPIVICISICALAGGYLWLSYKARVANHETVRRAMELGQQLDAESLKVLTSDSRSTLADMRGGVVAGAVGVAFLVVGVVIELAFNNDGQFAIIIGILALGLGAGRLIAWKLAEKLAR